MNQFGNRENFALEYEISSVSLEDDSGWDWANIYFWLKNKNLFAFKNDKPQKTVLWNVFFLVDWLCNNLTSIMDRDIFPRYFQGNSMNIQGKTSFELYDNFEKFQKQFSEDDDEYYQLHDIRFAWLQSHCLWNAGAGALLPGMFFRAVNNKIEISWDNKNIYEDRGDVRFVYEKGLEYVDRNEFFEIVVGFLDNYIEQFENQHKSVAELRIKLNDVIRYR